MRSEEIRKGGFLEGATVIEMRGVTKIYRTRSVETVALRDLDLTVGSGEFVAVMGPSGSGKTTLLNVTGLLDEFDAGEFKLGGVEVSRLSEPERCRLRNRKIGFVFQSFNLIPDLDVYDNVQLPLIYRGIAAEERRRTVGDVLKILGLEGRRSHYPSEISGGQQQRVAIARALVGSPEFILADEPTGNLDSHMAEEILKLLAEIHERGTTILMVTHHADQAAVAERQIHLLDGAIDESAGGAARMEA